MSRQTTILDQDDRPALRGRELRTAERARRDRRRPFQGLDSYSSLAEAAATEFARDLARLDTLVAAQEAAYARTSSLADRRLLDRSLAVRDALSAR